MTHKRTAAMHAASRRRSAQNDFPLKQKACRPQRMRHAGCALFAKTKLFDERTVSLKICARVILEQLPPRANYFEQRTL